MDNTNQENYINLDEAAEYLGIKQTTLRSWIKDPKNEIPAHKVGRMWKFKRSEIDDWINSGKSAIVE
ncbi:helix-turn-helix domain-containing protein [uncultured Dysosmobacter sp.]|uniref:helix-turn-helix domain-containing protein n=1 Tax=uncultured Dysosmobacter sp. TaxID=2591384 RepID=UPI002622D8D5|nr:helix-turn-helix domain-containing protein [uncultured Dysosmobacter sp.]